LRIADQVRGFGPVVAIGIAKRGIASAPRPNLLMLEVEEHHWFAAFEALSAASRVIMAPPGDTRGVSLERQSLVERGLVSKTVLIRLRSALDKLVPAGTPGAEPLATAMKRLEPFEVRSATSET
jgi:hypothetical protein